MKWPSLNLQILLGAVFGVALGAYFHDLGASHPLSQGGVYAASLLGTLFIDLLKMILIPLVFCSIAVGIANLRQHQQMHRVWVSTLVFFISSMAICLLEITLNLGQACICLCLSMPCKTLKPSNCPCRHF
jgi:Na+/H+-dicarboxylate symporter